MDREGHEGRLYETSAVAKEVGLPKATLNKLARVYEQVHGELPRGQRHTRLWTLEAIERIRSARLAVHEGRAVNMKTALRGFEDHSTLEQQSFAAPSTQTPARSSEGTPEAGSPSRLLEALVGELHALREAIEDQNKLLRFQSHRLQRLEEAFNLPEIATADPANKEASPETPHSPESSAEDQEEGEKAQRTGTERRRLYQSKLLRFQSHRLQRLEEASTLPEIATADPANKEASPETPHSPESSAEDQEEGEKAQRTGTERRRFGVIRPIMLLTVSIAFTVVAALYNNALLLTASLAVATISFLLGLYYYVKG
jgi:hypothetical protein